MASRILRVSVELHGAEAAAAVATLLDEGADGLSLFETDEAGDLWRLDAYAKARRLDAELEVRVRLAASGAGGEVLALFEEPVVERDWLEETKRAFPPLWVGRFLVHGLHWQPPARDGAIALEIDAASAFGTGEHPSTSGCLLALDQLARGRRFRAPLDIGTGSGILAIGAARRLARRVRASDIDAESVRVARHHVRRNGLAGRVRVECAPGFRSRSLKGRRYDLIFANILARPLAQMARDLSRAIAPGGIAILSGLLTRQEAYVLAAYRRCGLRLVRRITIGEWSTLILGSGTVLCSEILGAG
ncbi:MAG TPA: 50S ribosomal protein L11 methyltransferase [Stellaceae bacterium]|jgi:ribosomal protein L11 methyltransferase|nr:50S ribosomal protein L11 methyltransferase [Stellaceae bacterium]